jgi:hypothetical protein
MNRPATGTNWGLGVIDKVGEAQFFLQKLESTNSFTESCYYASAFASACYSITEFLEARCARDAGQKTWWKNTRSQLEADAVYKFFSEARSGEVHQGDGIVAGIGFALVQTADGDLETIDKVMLKDGGPSGGSESPAVEARKYFRILLNTAREGFRQFGAEWDPTEALRIALKEY